jgi:UDP-N-acetylglucosamine acyltransferase
VGEGTWWCGLRYSGGMPKIHPSAIVSRGCEIAESVEIGPNCVLDGAVTLGENVKLVGSVYVNGPVKIGAGTVVYPFACVGFPPQDFKFSLGMKTAGVVVGDGCIIRENATIHAASKPDVPTKVGDRVFMMNGSHVGHDATVGDDVVMVSMSALGGHSWLGNKVTLGGGTMIHQFVRIGRMAFISGGSALSTDVPPFCMGWGRNLMPGLNLVGMRRSGMAREHITAVKRAYVEVFRAHLPRKEMISRLEEMGATCPPLMEMGQFIRDSKRSICRAAEVRGVSASGDEE